MIRFGETVSEMGNRTKRTFKPNIQYCNLYSEALGKKINIRVSPEVLIRIDEAGGLDNYILNQPFPESWYAERLKVQILQNRLTKEKEAARLTTDPTGDNAPLAPSFNAA